MASIRMVGFLFPRKAEKSHILLLSANWMPRKADGCSLIKPKSLRRTNEQMMVQVSLSMPGVQENQYWNKDDVSDQAQTEPPYLHLFDPLWFSEDGLMLSPKGESSLSPQSNHPNAIYSSNILSNLPQNNVLQAIWDPTNPTK